jgi:hypothetical protein
LHEDGRRETNIDLDFYYAFITVTSHGHPDAPIVGPERSRYLRRIRVMDIPKVEHCWWKLLYAVLHILPEFLDL